MVEVISTNRAADLVTKVFHYAAAGLAEYWVVDPREHALSGFVLVDGVYEQLEHYRSGRVALTFDRTSVEVDVDALFG